MVKWYHAGFWHQSSGFESLYPNHLIKQARGSIAQQVERRTFNPLVLGSIPSGLTNGVWCNGNTVDFDSTFLGSNPSTPSKELKCSHRLTVRTLVFHTSNRGSIPRASTKDYQSDTLPGSARSHLCVNRM